MSVSVGMWDQVNVFWDRFVPRLYTGPAVIQTCNHSNSIPPPGWRRPLFSRVVLAFLFIAAGANHFVSPATYLRIMPPYLPMPLELVYLSGLFEIVGGVGLLFAITRRAAAWGLIVLLIAVFPANVYMWQIANEFPNIPTWALLLRLPLQLLLMAWVWTQTSACIDGTNDNGHG